MQFDRTLNRQDPRALVPRPMLLSYNVRKQLKYIPCCLFSLGFQRRFRDTRLSKVILFNLCQNCSPLLTGEFNLQYSTNNYHHLTREKEIVKLR